MPSIFVYSQSNPLDIKRSVCSINTPYQQCDLFSNLVPVLFHFDRVFDRFTDTIEFQRFQSVG